MNNVKEYLAVALITGVCYYLFKEFVKNIPTDEGMEDLVYTFVKSYSEDSDTIKKETPGYKNEAISILTSKGLDSFSDNNRLAYAQRIFEIAKDADANTKSKAIDGISKIMTNAWTNGAKADLVDYITQLAT